VWNNGGNHHHAILMEAQSAVQRSTDKFVRRYFRSGRLYFQSGSWYVAAREGDIGPFETRRAAEIALNRLVLSFQKSAATVLPQRDALSAEERRLCTVLGDIEVSLVDEFEKF
jgi:hypothetical protein